jgi:hypothetical protein
MRPVQFLAALFLFTTPLTAQEPASLAAQEAVPGDAERAVPVADAPVVRAGQAALDPVATAPVMPDFGFRTVGVQTVEFDSRAGTAMEPDAAALQPDRRNWWWTVGAIVTAGLILALVL